MPGRWIALLAAGLVVAGVGAAAAAESAGTAGTTGASGTAAASGTAPARTERPVTTAERVLAGAAREPTGVERVVVYRPPVNGPLQVLRGFDPPLGPYGPGHRGVDLRARSAVVAAADGVAGFAGQVAGRGVVVLVHPDGIRTEYEPLRPAVRVGESVRAGQVIGVVAGRHRGCPGVCLHWGARRGADYLDPLGLLRPLGPVRLLAWGPAGP